MQVKQEEMEEWLKAVYGDLPNGYVISPEDRFQIDPGGKGATYGEILPSSVIQLLKVAKLNEEDVFCDLGSGIGKLVMQVAFMAPVKCSWGIEASQERSEVAQRAKEKSLELVDEMQKKRLDQAIKFSYGDFTKLDLSDVSVAFMCSTCFRPEVLNDIARKLLKSPKLRLVFSLSPFPEETEAAFQLQEQFPLPMTWSSNSKMSVFRPRE